MLLLGGGRHFEAAHLDRRDHAVREGLGHAVQRRHLNRVRLFRSPGSLLAVSDY